MSLRDLPEGVVAQHVEPGEDGAETAQTARAFLMGELTKFRRTGLNSAREVEIYTRALAAALTIPEVAQEPPEAASAADAFSKLSGPELELVSWFAHRRNVPWTALYDAEKRHLANMCVDLVKATKTEFPDLWAARERQIRSGRLEAEYLLDVDRPPTETLVQRLMREKARAGATSSEE